MLKRLVLSIALAGCASAPQVRVDPGPRVSSLEVAGLTGLMQLEDTRTFDTTAFNLHFASSSAFIRARTSLAAGRIGNRAAVPLLLRALTDPHDSVRTYAAFALGELGDTSAIVAQALSVLSRARGAAPREAIHALGKIGGPHARPHVENVLRTAKEGPEIQEALLAIWRFPRQPSTSALVKPFVTSKDPEVRRRAIYALVRPISDPANVPDFQRWARHSDPMVRALAVRGLRAATADSARQRDQSASVLLSALADPHPHVRINAVGVLAGYRNETHAQRAALMLNDADYNVRIAAAQALGLMRGDAAVAALQRVISDPQQRPVIKGIALASLAQASALHGQAAAVVMASSPDAVLRTYAARALANVKTADAMALLRSLSNDPDLRVQIAAVTSAAGIAGDTLQATRAFFMEKLASHEPWVRAAALGGLERLVQPGDEVVVMEAFEFALRDRIDDAANAALAVLAKLAEKNPAIQHSFVARFPLSRIPLQDVQKAAIRELKLDARCCELKARPQVYARVVRDLLVPALATGYKPTVRVTTTAGSFDLELLPADAPLTVDNFMSLARRKYFDGGRWHRVVPNFVLQDGDPTGTGNGGPGYAIRDEINRVRYLRGVLGMALSGQDTGGSQWFITHSPQPHLDGDYTVFGRVVRGIEIADAVVQEDLIRSIEVIQ